MRTFHRGSGDQARFWSISQTAESLTLRYGKVGSPGRAQTLQYDSVSHARLDLLQRIVQKLEQGYLEVAPVLSMRQALEAALVADPDDLAGHMAYADWLSEQADPADQARAEFIGVQLALEDASHPEKERLRQREQGL